MPRAALEPTQLHVEDFSVGYFAWGKAAWSKFHKSLQSIADVKNKWSSASTYLS
jgi:hypothetical protein